MVPDMFGLGTSDLAAIATVAPSRAARSAIARPMPREAPVMKRVWPLRVGMERAWGMGNEGNEGNEASLALRGRRGVGALRCGFKGGVRAGCRCTGTCRSFGSHLPFPRRERDRVDDRG